MTDNLPVCDEEEENVIGRRAGRLDDTSQISVSSMVGQSKRQSVAQTFKYFLVKRAAHFSEDDSRTNFANQMYLN